MGDIGDAVLRRSPQLCRDRGATASGFPENALDIVDGNPVDLGDLGCRHAVLYPATDARELRPRNLARRLRLRADRYVDLRKTVRRRRRDSQHTRFPRRSVGRWRARNPLLGDLTFRGEQRLGRLTRSIDPLAIIAVRVGLLAKQDLLRAVDLSATQTRICELWQAGLGKPRGHPQAQPLASARVPLQRRRQQRRDREGVEQHQLVADLQTARGRLQPVAIEAGGE